MEGEADGNQMFGDHLSDTSEQFVLSDYPCDQSGDSPPWAGKQAWLAPPRMAKTGEALRAVCVCTCAGRVFPEKTYESRRNSCLGYLRRWVWDDDSEGPAWLSNYKTLCAQVTDLTAKHVMGPESSVGTKCQGPSWMRGVPAQGVWIGGR